MLNNKILKLKHDDYENVYSDIEDYARKSSKLVAIGRFGEVKNPSISDLDIFLCFNDEDFKNSRKKILEYIKTRDLHDYLCSHDPLIVPHSLINDLNKLHTLYGLNITFSRTSIDLNENSIKYNKFLEAIWSTFLLPILITVIVHKEKYDDRFKLLLLKNIHQSISNFKDADEYLTKSNTIRNKYINGNFTTENIDQELHNSSVTFLKYLSKVDFGLQKDANSYSYYLKRNRRYLLSNDEDISYEVSSRSIQIFLNYQLFKLLESIFYNNTQTENIYLNEYIYTSNKVYEILRGMKGPYPFITPFNYPFFKKGFVFQTKKFISRFIP